MKIYEILDIHIHVCFLEMRIFFIHIWGFVQELDNWRTPPVLIDLNGLLRSLQNKYNQGNDCLCLVLNQFQTQQVGYG